MFQIRFCLLIFGILNGEIYAQHNQSVPDIVLLSEEFFNVTRLTCIAGTNAMDSALVFNTGLDLKIPTSASVYKSRYNYNAKIFNCNFENLTMCHQAYNTANSKLTLTESGTQPIAPVLDERWEKFPINKENQIEVRYNRELSIKIDNKTKLMLCRDKIKPCKNINVTNSIVGNLTKWKHFSISVSETNKKITILGDTRQTFSVNNTNNMFIKSNSGMVWKSHTYKYVTLNHTSDDVQIGPQYNANRTDTLCISMYVTACGRCTFELQIMDEMNHTVSNVILVQSKLHYNTVSWRKVRLIAEITKDRNYRLIAKQINEYLVLQSLTISTSFWAIDDIRECHVDEIRVATLYTMDPNMSCEALKFPNWNTKLNNQNKTKEVFNCKDSRYIGPYCNVSCQMVLESQNCDRNILCQPTRENLNGKCGCAEGYYGPNCNKDCQTGYVVHKCRKLLDHMKSPLFPEYQCDESEKTCSTDHIGYLMYLPLLALLLIPVILFLLYRFVLKRIIDPHYIEVAPRVGSYIEVINESTLGSISNIPMVEQDGSPLYENVENFTKISDLNRNNHSIYDNIAMETQYANVGHATENIYVNLRNLTPGTSSCFKAGDLEKYIRMALKNQAFEKQYASVPQSEMKPCKYGGLKANLYKNQYKNVLPYDDNRVILDKINVDPYSDYINASYIQGYHGKQDYIATQHPSEQTVNDFWRMIWQENVRYIVMLANTNNNKKIIRSDECYENCSLSRSEVRKQQSHVNYWPKLHKTEEYGQIKVAQLYTESHVSYEVRTFEAVIGTERKRIHQLAFTSWPDSEIPNHPQYFTEFVREVSKISLDNASPIVVHCSAGIGRTGALILCDICLRMINDEGTVDVLKYLHEIQNQRAGMINNILHYKLVYLTILECLLSPKIEFSSDKDFHLYETNMLNEKKLQEQIDILDKITYFENALVKTIKYKCDSTNDPRNRFSEIIPEYDCIQLTDHQMKNKDTYDINAIPVDGYKKNNQFIVTQFPLPNTLPDFWRMVFKKHVKVIVSLNDIPLNDTTCCEFWPTNNEEFQPIQSLSIEHVKTEHYEFHNVFTLVFKTLYVTDNVEDRTVYVIQLQGWAPHQPTPERVFHLYRMVGEVDGLWKGKLPIVVTCYNGANAAGLFVALTYLVNQITQEDVCDVYAAIRVIRKNRKQFVSNKEQLEFLHKGALNFYNIMQGQQIYENIGTIKY